MKIRIIKKGSHLLFMIQINYFKRRSLSIIFIIRMQPNKLQATFYQSQKLLERMLNNSSWRVLDYDHSNHYIKPSLQNIISFKMSVTSMDDLSFIKSHFTNLKRLQISSVHYQQSQIDVSDLKIDTIEELILVYKADN